MKMVDLEISIGGVVAEMGIAGKALILDYEGLGWL